MLTIYPKKGKPFTVEFNRFEIADEEISLHGSTNADATGYLTTKDIAAIMPDSARGMSDHTDLRVFTVYLKRHLDTPLRIVANAYKKDSPQVTFHYRHYEMSEIYIATDAVLGITFVRAESQPAAS